MASELIVGHFSDVHILEGARTFGEVRNSLYWCLEDMESAGAELALCTGDVYGRRIGHVATELERVTFGGMFHEYGIDAIIEYGNHDRPLSLEPLGWLPNVDVASSPAYFQHDSVSVACVPWASKARFIKERCLDKAAADAAVSLAMMQLLNGMVIGAGVAPRILAAHLLVGGAQSGGGEVLNGLEPQITFADVAELFERNDHLRYFALGHLHKPQIVVEGFPCAYAGQLCAQDFGESSGARGYMLARIPLHHGATWRDTVVEFRENPHSPIFQTVSYAWEGHKNLKPGEWKVLTDPPRVLYESVKADRVRGMYLKIRLAIPDGQQARAAAATPALVGAYAEGGWVVDEPEVSIVAGARARELSELVFSAAAGTSTEERLRLFWSSLEPPVMEEEQDEAAGLLAELDR